jgi:uncharacterized protein (DUF488 family)
VLKSTIARRETFRTVAPKILTICHSTHEIDRFLRLIRSHRVQAVADVRRYPMSRRHPQFNTASLAEALRAAGIDYSSLADELGGRRRPRAGSPNTAWRMEGFRGYADHMGGPAFAAGIDRLQASAATARTAVLCAEEDWRRCHRRLIADALLVGGWSVVHIRGDGSLERHELTPFASPTAGGIRYPPPQTALTD